MAIDDENTPLSGDSATANKAEKVEEKEEVQVEDQEIPTAGEVKKSFLERSWWWWLLIIIAVISGAVAYEKKASKNKKDDVK